MVLHILALFGIRLPEDQSLLPLLVVKKCLKRISRLRVGLSLLTYGRPIPGRFRAICEQVDPAHKTCIFDSRRPAIYEGATSGALSG